MAYRRQARLEMNFDGLTDSVTNLVGSLILLVGLVIAATQVKQAGVRELPPPENQPGGQQSMAPLLREIHKVKDQVNGLDQALGAVEARLRELSQKLDGLRERSRETH